MTRDAELIEADREARERALDTRRSFIVQAPAGSGKTELLIQRYLRLLARVDEPEEVLAITFTRKAAAEMRERVVAALTSASLGNRPDAPHLQITFNAAGSVLERDAERGWSLLKLSHRFRILTLDAFNAGIARRLPVTSGLATSGNVIQDSEATEVYRRAARSTLDWLATDDELGECVRNVLEHVDGSAGRYILYLSRMLQTRDQWLNITGSGAVADPQGVRELLERNVAELVSRQLAVTRARLETASDATMGTLLAYAAATLRDNGTDTPWPDGMAELPGTEAADLEAWKWLTGLMLTGRGDWRRSVNKNQGFPPGDEGEKAAWIGLLRDLSGDVNLQQDLQAVTRLPRPEYSDSQWAVLVALFRVLPLAVTELRREFGERGCADHTEVALAAAAALGSAAEPGDIALMLDYRIRHVLVDEMQDTSISQYRMLETLTGGWSPDDGRTFFCVGDPMQSIYRFRNAEVGQFVRARTAGLAGLPLESLTLRRNFRSGEGLVHWFNDVFARVLPDLDEPTSGAVSYSASAPVPEQADTGDVQVTPLFETEAIDEARQVCGLVSERLAKCPGEDIAVLVRSRTQLPDLLSYLRQARIPYQAIEIDRLSDLKEIIDLLALTRAICHSGDRAAWLALLRGPYAGLDWVDLHRLVAGTTATIPELLHDEARLQTLSTAGRERALALREALESGLGIDRSLGLRERLERVWYALGGPELLQDATEIEHAYRYLDLIESHEMDGTLGDIATLQSLLDGQRVSAAHDESRVTVMTMHKSKGLEFDHVILPFLGRYTSSSEQAVLSWLNVPAAGGGSDLVLSPVGPAYELENDPLHAYIEGARRRSERLEQDRLLYVACTRAKRTLHLVAGVSVSGDAPKPPDPRSMLASLWPALQPEVLGAFAQSAPKPADSEADDSALFVLPRLWRRPSDWSPATPPALPAAIESIDVLDDQATPIHYEWVGAMAREAGVFVHRWLERWVAAGRLPDREALADVRSTTERWAHAAGLRGNDVDQVCTRVRAALEGILADPKGRWILDGPGEAELPLTGVWRGQITSIVIDRIRIDDDGNHWIIDYKTSSHEGGDLDGFLKQETERYAEQLARYRHLYSAYSGTRGIRTALYFPLMQEFREVTPAA